MTHMLVAASAQGHSNSKKSLGLACVSYEASVILESDETPSPPKHEKPKFNAFPGVRFHNVDREIKTTTKKKKDNTREQTSADIWDQTKTLLEKLLANRVSYEKLVSKGIIVPREIPTAFASCLETKLHEKLPLTKVLPITTELAYSLEGPDVIAGDGDFTSYEDLASAWSVSTYPHIPERPEREGDPICDRYSLYGYGNRALVVFTDGCNWGAKSKEASYRANDIFGKLMKQSLDEITDLRKAGLCLLRALDEAHYGIIQTNTEESQAGSTTILGGLLMQVEGVEKKKKLLGVGGNDKKPKWVYLCLSVGDCKTFHYSHRSGKFTDVTKGNRRAVNDPCDPGGRIGLYMENERPDLRNIAFYITECEEDDLLFVVSDGVHDNFDAQFMGMKPKDLNLPIEAWEENVKNPEEVTDKKHKWVVELLDRMFKDEVSPAIITRRVVEHARALTKRYREFTEQHPMKRLPRDVATYTGKMDHTTCCAFKVSAIKGAPERKARPPVPPRRSVNLTAAGTPALLQPTVSSPSLLGGGSGSPKRAASATLSSQTVLPPRTSSPLNSSVSSSALPTFYTLSSPSVT